MRLRTGLIATFGLVVAALLSSLIASFPFSFAKKVEPIGDAYSVTARYIYKGEPVTIEFAFGCGGIKTTP